MSGWGEFTGNGEEYIVKQPNLSQPLRNYMFGRSILSTVDQVAGGDIFIRHPNGQTNGLINKEIGRLIYLRDNETNDFWSPTWFPAKVMLDFFEVRFGLGQTIITSSAYGIETTLVIYPHPAEPFEIWKVSIVNKTESKKRLSVLTAVPWKLGSDEAVETIGGRNLILTTNFRENLEHVPVAAFFRISEEANNYFRWEGELLSQYESLARPKTVVTGKLKKDAVHLSSPMSGFQKNLNLAGGGSYELTFFVGAIFTDNRQSLNLQKGKLTERITGLTNNRAGLLSATRSSFPIRVSTPEKEFDRYVNSFLQYQNELLVSWPSTNWLVTVEDIHRVVVGSYDEEASEACLFRLLGNQRKDGSVIHGWKSEAVIEELEFVVSDTLTLIDTVVTHLERFGDLELLRSSIEFRDGGEGTILEHLTKAVQFVIGTLTTSHMLTVNEREETALSARLVYELRRVAAVMEAKNEEYLVKKYRQLIEVISAKIEKTFWAPPWYSRGRDAQGSRIGTTITTHGWDLAAQLWPILAAIPNISKTKTLVSRLAKQTAASGPLNFTDPYLKSSIDSYQLSSTNPGQGKNSVIDTELAAHLIAVAAIAGEGEVAWRIATQLQANFLSANPDRYQAEPFWQAETIDGPQSITPGRGHSRAVSPAPFLIQAILEQIFGLKSTLDGLIVDPCLPKSWRQVEVSYKWRGADLNVRIQNPFRTGSGVNRVMVDGIRLNGSAIKALKPGTHFIEVILG